MKVEFNLSENDKFSPITVASAIVDKIEESSTMSEDEKDLFLQAIADHLSIYCANKLSF